MKTKTKPDYRIPSMAEIAKIRGTNGYKVVSTFSGCGGSCLGLEMAGFQIAWASEFIPEAAETYKLNHPGVFVDTRDIRRVDPDTLMTQLGLKPGELDLFEGSPPCSPFSTAGRRSKDWGASKEYSDSAKQRVDDLFFEFIRLLEGLQPKVFIAENVAGLTKGVAKGYFLNILADMKAAGYEVAAKVLDAQWLGVPQVRKRTIFIGVRKDLTRLALPSQGFPAPLPYRYTIRNALDNFQPIGRIEAESWLTKYAIGGEWRKLRPGESSSRYFSLVRANPDAPVPTVTQTGGVTSAAAVAHPHECRKFSIAELKRLSGFPDDFQLTGNYRQRYERLGRAVPPPMYAATGQAIAEKILKRIGSKG